MCCMPPCAIGTPVQVLIGSQRSSQGPFELSHLQEMCESLSKRWHAVVGTPLGSPGAAWLISRATHGGKHRPQWLSAKKPQWLC